MKADQRTLKRIRWFSADAARTDKRIADPPSAYSLIRWHPLKMIYPFPLRELR
jgi:hypothetical protein